MPARTHVIAGRCTTAYDGADAHEQRGDVVVVCKPDDTVLVHDADGYQPVAWLTRADRVAIDEDGLTAWEGDTTLRVTVHERHGGAEFPTSRAGPPVGDCPDCGTTLLQAGGGVTCPDCDSSYGLPADATILEETCETCGLPRFAVHRGQRFTLCVDPACESLDDRVTDAFDREWACPDCGDDLRVIRRGGLLLGCDAYPDCDWNTAVPRGDVVADCGCGLPIVETGDGRHCLDTACERPTRAGTP
jgi:DNA topoisomerase-1